MGGMGFHHLRTGPIVPGNRDDEITPASSMPSTPLRPTTTTTLSGNNNNNNNTTTTSNTGLAGAPYTLMRPGDSPRTTLKSPSASSSSGIGSRLAFSQQNSTGNGALDAGSLLFPQGASRPPPSVAPTGTGRNGSDFYDEDAKGSRPGTFRHPSTFPTSTASTTAPLGRTAPGAFMSTNLSVGPPAASSTLSSSTSLFSSAAVAAPPHARGLSTAASTRRNSAALSSPFAAPLPPLPSVAGPPMPAMPSGAGMVGGHITSASQQQQRRRTSTFASPPAAPPAPITTMPSMSGTPSSPHTVVYLPDGDPNGRRYVMATNVQLSQSPAAASPPLLSRLPGLLPSPAPLRLGGGGGEGGGGNTSASHQNLAMYRSGVLKRQAPAPSSGTRPSTLSRAAPRYDDDDEE